jgi:hypothetical protein
MGLNAPSVLSGQAEEMGDLIVESAVPVMVGFRLQQITDVNQKAENFSAVASMRMAWDDPSLAFSPEECNCVNKSYTQKNFGNFIQEVGGQ